MSEGMMYLAMLPVLRRLGDAYVFTALRYAGAVYAVVVYLLVRPSVRPSVTSRHCIKTAKRIGSHKQRHSIVQ